MSWLPSDKWLKKAVIIGALLRLVPVCIWIYWPCVRDECTYLRLAERMVAGEGMTASNGWIWAPGYPALVALHEALFTNGMIIKGTQVIASMYIIVLMFRLGARLFSPRAGYVAAWLYALSPTQIFFAQSLWSECLYGGLLLLAVWAFEHSSDQQSSSKPWVNRLPMVAWTGILLGGCVLFRGVATYMLPIFMGALLWGRLRQRAAWKQALVLCVATMLTVAPYSLYASSKFGTFMISDRTLGQMMWLGNNDFKPVTFDWGNGQLSGREFKRHTSTGRKPCGSKKKPVERDQCQTSAGVDWIKNNPDEFARRMPLRVAQMINPHSFLTRHIRWGEWQGLPRLLDESLIVLNVLWNCIVLIGGSVGLCLYGRRRSAVLIAGILLYHIAAISVLAGLTRYRVPLEPLLMLYVGGFFVEDKLSPSRWRWFGCATVLAFLLPLMAWFFPTAWVGWRHW